MPPESATSIFRTPPILHIFKHGQFLNKGGNNYQGGPWLGRKEPWAQKITHQDLPLSNLYLTMLQRLGVKAKSFGGSSQTLDEV